MKNYVLVDILLFWSDMSTGKTKKKATKDRTQVDIILSS